MLKNFFFKRFTRNELNFLRKLRNIYFGLKNVSTEITYKFKKPLEMEKPHCFSEFGSYSNRVSSLFFAY